MKTLLFIVLGLLLPMTVPAQADTAAMIIDYDAEYRTCEELSVCHDRMRLLVGGQCSKFYSVAAQEQRQRMDSLIMSTGGDMSQTIVSLGSLNFKSEVGQKYLVLKNYPAEGKLTYASKLMTSGFKYEEPMPELDWQLADGDTLIAGYRCYKAQAAHRGRAWTAWYAPDITVSDGPWKLCGLPGLILMASTDDGLFSFVCTGIRKGNGEEIGFDKKAYKTTTPEDLQKLETLGMSNPEKLATRLNGTNVQVITNRKGGARKRTPVLIEDYGKE